MDYSYEIEAYCGLCNNLESCMIFWRLSQIYKYSKVGYFLNNLKYESKELNGLFLKYLNNNVLIFLILQHIKCCRLFSNARRIAIFRRYFNFKVYKMLHRNSRFEICTYTYDIYFVWTVKITLLLYYELLSTIT